MSIGSHMLKAYFNYVYNPVYDFAVGRLALYRKLQQKSIIALDVRDGDRILCAGLGTGNEINHIISTGKDVQITGVDYSESALKKAAAKAKSSGKNVDLLPMDVRTLDFPDGSFDKVLCLHVMDFVYEREEATGEILRVLKTGGLFAVTYPSEVEGMSMGMNVLRENIRHGIASGQHRIIATITSVAQMLTGIVYLPLVFRKKKAMSRDELRLLYDKLLPGESEHITIDNFPLYNDYIVVGKKTGEKFNAS